MRILLIFFMAALVGCYGGRTKCNEKGFSCMESLVEMDRSDFTKLVLYCKELGKTIACLQEAAESCDEEDVVIAMRPTIQSLKDWKKQTCRLPGTLSHNEEIQKCSEENNDYLSECLHLGVNEVEEALAGREKEENFEDRKKCGLFVEAMFCTGRRLEERCGREALEEFARLVGNGPEEVRKACEIINLFIESGLDERKKK